MVKPVTPGQVAEVIARFATEVDWSRFEPGILQMDIIEMPREEFGRRFTAFIENRCRLLVENATSFYVDRSKPSADTRGIGPKFFAPEYEIEEEDFRSHLILRLNFNKVLFLGADWDSREVHRITTLGEQIGVLRSMGHIRLDARVGRALHEERGQEVLRWMYAQHGFRNILFPGTILRRVEDGKQYLMQLSRDEKGGSWSIGTRCLEKQCHRGYVVPGIKEDNLPLWSSQGDGAD